MKPSRNLNALVAETDTPTQTLKAIIELNKEKEEFDLGSLIMSLAEKENADERESP